MERRREGGWKRGGGGKTVRDRQADKHRGHKTDGRTDRETDKQRERRTSY